MKGRSLLLGLAGSALVALAAVVAIATVGDRLTGAQALAMPARSAGLIERGAYLARLGDCEACHSVRGKPAFSGGLPMQTPIGAVYTTNITPDETDGIGRFSLTDFDRALRYGVANGHSLYPAMPFTSYYNTKPEDVQALYAYFRYAVAPAHVPNRSSEIPFPLSMRWPLTYWRWFFASRPVPFRAPADEDAVLAQGAYFVDGLGHCGECHTPRNAFMQLKAVTRSAGPQYLTGAVIETYFAPSLRSDGLGSLQDWSEEQLARFLRTGASSRGIAFGSMSDVIIHSTQYMTEADAKATAHYLKSLDAERANDRSYAYDASTEQALRRGDATQEGALMYLDSCAACHRTDGRGYERVFPALAGNAVVEAQNADSVVSIILRGSQTPRTAQTPAEFTMPAFAWRLSDIQVMQVANFVRSSWGNRGAEVTLGEVTRLRSQAH
jgi:alcohol dehydrogenase (quinone), cytochrome c subunit